MYGGRGDGVTRPPMPIFLIDRPQLTVDPLCITFTFVGAASQGLSGSIGGSVKGDLCLTRGRFC
jgi:hypothetical protein